MTDNDTSHPCSRNKKFYSSFIPATLAVVAMICSCAGTFYCQTVSFDMGDQLITGNSTNDESTLLWVGIFEYQDPRKPYSCLSYDNIVESREGGGDRGVVDPKWKAIKVISVFSLILGCLVTVVAIFLPCSATTQQDRWWKVVGVVLLAVLAMSHFVNIVLLRNSNICKFHRNPAVQFYNYNQDGGNDDGTNNDDQCQWAAGLLLLVFATVAFALAGIAVFLRPTPSSWVPEPRQTQQVTYERTVHPDGTTTVEKVQVVIGVVET